MVEGKSRKDQGFICRKTKDRTPNEVGANLFVLIDELEQKASTGIVKNDHIHIRVGYVASLTGDRYTGSGQRGQEVSMLPAVRCVL